MTICLLDVGAAIIKSEFAYCKINIKMLNYLNSVDINIQTVKKTFFIRKQDYQILTNISRLEY